MKTIMQSLIAVFLLLTLSGCIAVAAISTAVDVTTTVVGGAIDVVDAVTPDIIDDDEDEDEDEDDEKEKSDEEKQ